MEFIWLLAPFLLTGFCSAIVTRVTGVTISFLIAPVVLLLGATPEELVSFMLTFLLYYLFTEQTQHTRLDLQKLKLFSGIRKGLVLIATIVVAFFSPFVAIGGFILCFILELAADIYMKEPKRERIPISQLATYIAISSIMIGLGSYCIRFVEPQYFYALVGLGIIFLTAFAAYAGSHRFSFEKTWYYIWSLFGFFLGFLGLEASSYIKGLSRENGKKSWPHFYGIAIMISVFMGFSIFSFMYQIFSVPALVCAIGAGIGTRFVGVYEFTDRGRFNLVTIVCALLIAIILLLAQPETIGFGVIENILQQPK